MTFEDVYDKIYEHITLEYKRIGVLPKDCWETINKEDDWVIESTKIGYSWRYIVDDLFDGVYSEWLEENT